MLVSKEYRCMSLRSRRPLTLLERFRSGQVVLNQNVLQFSNLFSLNPDRYNNQSVPHGENSSFLSYDTYWRWCDVHTEGERTFESSTSGDLGCSGSEERGVETHAVNSSSREHYPGWADLSIIHLDDTPDVISKHILIYWAFKSQSTSDLVIKWGELASEPTVSDVIWTLGGLKNVFWVRVLGKRVIPMVRIHV